MTQVVADWTQRSTGREIERDIGDGFRFLGPGFYLTKTDTALVVPIGHTKSGSTMNYELAVAMENFVPLNQQQRESKAVIEVEIKRLQAQAKRLQAYPAAVDSIWNRRWPEEQRFAIYVYNCSFEHTIFSTIAIAPVRVDDR